MLALLTRNISVIGVALYDPRILQEIVAMWGDLRGNPTLAASTRGRSHPPGRLDDGFTDLAASDDAVRTVIRMFASAR